MIRRMILNTDFCLFIFGLIFTVASMALSGYFGWMRAAGSPYMAVQFASMLMWGSVAGALAWAVVRRERLRYEFADKPRKPSKAFKSKTRLICFLIVANIATDFMATKALFALSNTRADNINTDAQNARARFASIESRLKKRKNEKAWLTPYEKPETYDALINAQKQEVENGRNIWKRSKQCTDTTVETSKVVCQKIADLTANKANAKYRHEVLIPEIKELEKQLEIARKDVQSNRKTTDVAGEPVNDLTALILQQLKLSSSDKHWGETFFVLFSVLVMTGAIYNISKEQGRRLGPLPEYQAFGFERYAHDDDEDTYSPRRQLAAPAGHEPAEVTRPPIPLKATDAPPPRDTTTPPPPTVYHGEQVTDSLTELERLAQRLAARNAAAQS